MRRCSALADPTELWPRGIDCAIPSLWYADRHLTQLGRRGPLQGKPCSKPILRLPQSKRPTGIRLALRQRQNELRDIPDDDGYAEPNLWTGIGRARSGAGAAIVGDPDQVLAKIRAYADLGMDAFILSGYPHAAEANLFARHVLPHLDHAPLLPR